MTRKGIVLLIGIAICLGMVLLMASLQLPFIAGVFGILALIITSIYATEARRMSEETPNEYLQRQAKKHDLEQEVDDYINVGMAVGLTENECIERAIQKWDL